mgnify:CR=1 FL=1
MKKQLEGINLRKLEKYGFRYDKVLNKYTKVFDYGFFWRDIDVYIDNSNFKHREIKAYSSIITDSIKEEWIENNIQDLIKADLVEKVNE